MTEITMRVTSMTSLTEKQDTQMFKAVSDTATAIETILAEAGIKVHIVAYSVGGHRDLIAHPSTRRARSFNRRR